MQNAVFLCSTKESALIDDDSEDEEFSELFPAEVGGPGRRPGPPTAASLAGSTRRIGPVNRQMSDVSAISPRRMMKGRSPSAPSLGGRKLKRMDSTATTISQTSNNTSTSSIRGSVNSNVIEDKVTRLPKSLNQSQMQRYLNKGKEDGSFFPPNMQPDGYSVRSTESRISFNTSQSSESPSSSSMGVRPESVVSRQSRVVTVKSKTSVSSLGEQRGRSVSSVATVSRPERPESEQSVKQESTELPSFVQNLVWKVTDNVFIGNESVATNAHVLCRLTIGATVELYDGPDLDDNRRTFDNTCFCEKRSHARGHYKLKVPDNEKDAHSMATNKSDPYSLADMFRVFYDIVDGEIKKGNKRVLVFSRRGRNRAPAFCVGYLMKANGINRRAAQAIMDTMRPKISIENYLIRALLQWQLKLNAIMEQERSQAESLRTESTSMSEEPAALYPSTRNLFMAKAVNNSSTTRRGSTDKTPPKQAW